MIADYVSELSSKWWTFLLRGIFALALAAFAFGEPTATSGALVIVLAAYFVISGFTAIFAGISFTGVGQWWGLIIMGIIQTALGVIMFVEPGTGPLAVAYLFAIWMIMTGAMEITSAVTLRQVVDNEFWWILLGLVTLAFGVYVVLNPGIGLLALVYTIGIYAIFAGISLIGFAFRVKSLGSEVAKLREAR